jgi:exopolysaccharide biosynthesis WecB/TagA/CpsF family protein
VDHLEFRVKSDVIHINIATKDALWATVTAKLQSNNGFALATLNLDHLVKLSHSPSFRDAYTQQDLVVADGNPIVWLSRLAQKPVELIPGSELIVPLAKLAAQNNVSIALVGSTDTVLKKAASTLQSQVPELKVAICIAPPYGFNPSNPDTTTIFDEIKSSGAGICFLALGAPKQEVFAALGRDALSNIGFVSIGAGLDFIAGNQTRAPKWVRSLALEWLWRMLTNPLRLGPRYLRCIMIMPNLALGALKSRRKP